MTTKCMIGLSAGFLAMAALPASAQQVSQQPVQTSERHVNDLPGPIQGLTEMQDAGRLLFLVTDENGDGQISQKEAVDAANLSVGGMFFSADANGDGTLSKEEIDQARNQFLNPKPWLRYIVQSVRAAQKGSPGNATPIQGVVAILDTNNDQQYQAAEVRQLVQTTVESAFATIDINRDGQLTPAELNAGVTTAGQMVADAAFQNADADNNGQVSQAEFDKAIVEPANIAFKVADLNHDGQISKNESETIRQVLASKIRMINFPEPSNSPRNTLNRVLGTSNTPKANTSPSTTTNPTAPQPPQ